MKVGTLATVTGSILCTMQETVAALKLGHRSPVKPRCSVARAVVQALNKSSGTDSVQRICNKSSGTGTGSVQTIGERRSLYRDGLLEFHSCPINRASL